jgi:hypothetical protein
MERWKPIADFEAYEVSDLGRVRRILGGQGARAGKCLRPRGSGYKMVSLYIGNVVYARYIHRLVAQEFVPNLLNLPEVNHKKKKSNNRATNLEWRSSRGHGIDRAKREQGGDGVHFSKRRKKYLAKYNPTTRKNVFLGYFSTKKEALAARRAAMRSLPNVL